MKKTLLTTLLLSGIALSVSTTAFAEEKIGPSETSKVEVDLKEDNGHDLGKGPFKDYLSIVYKPTLFKFSGYTTDGSLNLSNEHAKSSTQWLAVNDDRKDDSGAAKSGKWTLTGKLDGLKDGNTSLAANMVFKPGQLLKYDIGTDIQTVNGVQDIKPLPVDGSATAADDKKYTLAKEFTLPADNTEVTVLTSNTEEVSDPKGVVTNLGDVNLLIATGNAGTAGNYTGTITWTLTAQ